MDQLGRYRLLAPIAEGGIATVYRAYDPRLDRLVALKAFRCEVSVAHRLRARLYREAQAWAKARHDSLVAVHDVGQAEDRLFVVMELLDGNTLAARIAAGQPLPLEEALDLMVQICEGLHHAHRSGIVHRDVRPAKIFVPREGPVKLLAFATARLLAGDPGRLIVGRLPYMAPEQLQGTADHRADIFALGAVCYELFTGQRAFPGEDAIEVLDRVDSDAGPPSPAEVDPSLPPDLVHVVQRALARDPAERFPDVAEMAAALEFVRRRLVDDPERLAAHARGQLDQLRQLSDELQRRVRRPEASAVAAPTESAVAAPPRDQSVRGRASRRPRLAARSLVLAASLVVALGLGTLLGQREHGVGPVAPPAPAPAVGAGLRDAASVAVGADRARAAEGRLVRAEATTRRLLRERDLVRVAEAVADEAERARWEAEQAGATRFAAPALAEARRQEREAREARAQGAYGPSAARFREARDAYARVTREVLLAAAAREAPAVSRHPAPPDRQADEARLAEVTLPAPPAPAVAVARSEAPAAPRGRVEAWLASLREIFASETELRGVSGPVAWEVRDIRREVIPGSRQIRWAYTLVVRERDGRGIRFEREERSAREDGFEPVIVRALFQQELSPHAELTLPVHDATRPMPRDGAFEADLGQGRWVWHRFHGRDTAGQNVRIDVRFRLAEPPVAT